ncbi:MAG: hypothetical protein HC934_03155 [Acaryochloridaceae cyanobacterium SU_2_1]|nr:hypothetical protein [Acaryochloridaceae cyanobacterium SU_2_1]
MNHIDKIHCPNCGSQHGERHHIDQLIRTQCRQCDYLLVTYAATGKVVEAYAPGLYMSNLVSCAS